MAAPVLVPTWWRRENTPLLIILRGRREQFTDAAKEYGFGDWWRDYLVIPYVQQITVHVGQRVTVIGPNGIWASTNAPEGWWPVGTCRLGVTSVPLLGRHDQSVAVAFDEALKMGIASVADVPVRHYF